MTDDTTLPNITSNEITETATYADGNTVTGPAPLPDTHPVTGAPRASNSNASTSAITARVVARPGHVDIAGPPPAAVPPAAIPPPLPHPFEELISTPEQETKIERVRLALHNTYQRMLADVPPSPDRTLAFRHLQQAGFFATTAIVTDGLAYLH